MSNKSKAPDIPKITGDMGQAIFLIKSVIDEIRSRAGRNWRGGENIQLAALEKAGCLVDRANGMLHGSNKPECIGAWEEWSDWSISDPAYKESASG